MPIPIVLPYYSNLVTRLLSLELIFRTAIYKFCVCALNSLLLSALVSAPVEFSGDFTGAEDTAARRVLIPLLEGVQSVVESLGVTWITSDCTVILVEACLTYSRSLEV